MQLAHRFGAAQVLATVSGDDKARLALAAGADAVINYKTEDVPARVRELTAGHGVDKVIELDLAVNAAMDLELLRTGGCVVAYGSSPLPLNLPFGVLLAKNIQLKFFMVYHLDAADRARATATLQRLLTRGELQHNIAQRLPLAQCVQAHEAVEGGRLMGNLVLQVS